MLYAQDSAAKEKRLREVGPAIEADPEVVQASKRFQEAKEAFSKDTWNGHAEVLAANQALQDKQLTLSTPVPSGCVRPQPNTVALLFLASLPVLPPSRGQQNAVQQRVRIGRATGNIDIHGYH